MSPCPDSLPTTARRSRPSAGARRCCARREAILGGRVAGHFPKLGEVVRTRSTYEQDGTFDWATGAACVHVARVSRIRGHLGRVVLSLLRRDGLRIASCGTRLHASIRCGIAVMHRGGEGNVAPRLLALLTGGKSCSVSTGSITVRSPRAASGSRCSCTSAFARSPGARCIVPRSVRSSARLPVPRRLLEALRPRSASEARHPRPGVRAHSERRIRAGLWA